MSFSPIEKIESLYKKISRFDFYINSTNAKSSIIIAWNGVVVGTVLLKYNEIAGFYLNPKCVFIVSIISLVLIATSSLISIYFAFQVIYPFLKERTENIKSDSKSLLFFGSVANMSLDEYSRKELSSSYDEMLSDLIEQSHVLAFGLSEKMKNMQRSIRAINFQLILIFLLIVIRGFIVYV